MEKGLELSDAMKQAMALPQIANVISHAVVICNCPDHIVLVVEVIGGLVECPKCRAKWKIVKYHMNRTPVPGNPMMDDVHLEIEVGPGAAVTLGDASALAQGNGRQG